MLAPALLVLGLLFGGGLVAGLLRSFNYMPVIGLAQPDLATWGKVLTSATVWQSLGFSLQIALISTASAAVLALASAMLLRQSFAGRRLIGFLVQANLTVPHVVGALGILYLFAQSGMMARLAAAGGMIAEPAEFPVLVFDRQGLGIILHYIWKEVPFITLILLAALQGQVQDHEAAAHSLGAGPWQRFRYVTLPMLGPALGVACLISFAFCFGAYEVPLILGAHDPLALPVLAWQSYSNADLDRRPEAAAMAMLIAAVSGAVIFGVWRGLRRQG